MRVVKNIVGAISLFCERSGIVSRSRTKKHSGVRQLCLPELAFLDLDTAYRSPFQVKVLRIYVSSTSMCQSS